MQVSGLLAVENAWQDLLSQEAIRNIGTAPHAFRRTRAHPSSRRPRPVIGEQRCSRWPQMFVVTELKIKTNGC